MKHKSLVPFPSFFGRNFFFLFVLLLIQSCSFLGSDEDTPEPEKGDEVSNSLHFAFKTPEWEKFIDCTHLDLPSSTLTEGVYYTFASSQSTRSTFVISFPADSSEIVKESSPGRYAIHSFGERNELPFEFALKLPLNNGSSEYLVSRGGLSEDSFNEIVAVDYLGHEEGEAIFRLKGKYKMVMAVMQQEEVERVVSGTYSFKIRTTTN